MTELQTQLQNVETFDQLKSLLENLGELGQQIGLAVIEDLFVQDRQRLFAWLHDWDATHNEPPQHGLRIQLVLVSELEV